MSSSKVHIFTASTLFFLVICLYLITAFKFPLAYIVATYEDLVGEWAQVMLFFCTCILSIKLVFSKSNFRIFFAVLALASFYTFMEEISWGQRLFEISSPAFFKEHNLQQETNFHNFLTGPFNTDIKRGIEYLLFAGLMFYGLVYPLLTAFKTQFSRWLVGIGIPAPPLYLWPFFVTSAFLELGLLGFNEAEVAEILIPLGLTIFLAHYLVLSKIVPPPTQGVPLNSTLSRKLSLIIFTIFIGVIVSSSGLTYALYSSPKHKARIDRRINNGIEKFAGRYKRYEQWNIAVRLYHRIDKNEPNRPSIQRRLALGYKMLGNSEKSESYINRSLNINFNRITKKPTTISAHISQAITYRQINSHQQADFHLQSALKNALQRVEKKPNSANSAYWLGKTYSEMGMDQQALAQFQRALQIEPQKKKYMKAVLKTKIRLEKL